MKHVKIMLVFVICLISAGCFGIIGGESPSNIEKTPNGTSSAVTTSEPPTTTATPTPADTPTDGEREYLASGKEFTRVVGGRLEKIHHMEAVSRTIYRNNTVELTVRLNEGDPLYMGMMNVTQTVSLVLTARTSTNESKAFHDGIDGKVHRPRHIYINVQNPNGKYLGSFEIHPESATKYRLGMFDADVFAQNVENTLEVERAWKRGSHSPDWYLNRSQLVDWRRAYKIILRNETDPSEPIYTEKFPIDNISIYPSEMRIHHEMVWDQDKMGTGFVSAQAAMHTAYWKATDRAWAMAPLELSHYMDRPNVDDIRGHMHLASVYWLVKRPKNTTNLNAYLNMDEGQAVDDE